MELINFSRCLHFSNCRTVDGIFNVLTGLQKMKCCDCMICMLTTAGTGRWLGC